MKKVTWEALYESIKQITLQRILSEGFTVVVWGYGLVFGAQSIRRVFILFNILLWPSITLFSYLYFHRPLCGLILSATKYTYNSLVIMTPGTKVAYSLGCFLVCLVVLLIFCVFDFFATVFLTLFDKKSKWRQQENMYTFEFLDFKYTVHIGYAYIIIFILLLSLISTKFLLLIFFMFKLMLIMVLSGLLRCIRMFLRILAKIIKNIKRRYPFIERNLLKYEKKYLDFCEKYIAPSVYSNFKRMISFSIANIIMSFCLTKLLLHPVYGPKIHDFVEPYHNSVSQISDLNTYPTAYSYFLQFFDTLLNSFISDLHYIISLFS